MAINDENIISYLNSEASKVSSKNAGQILNKVTSDLYNNGYENLVDNVVDGNGLIYVDDVLGNQTDYDDDTINEAENADSDYLNEDGCNVDKYDVKAVISDLKFDTVHAGK